MSAEDLEKYETEMELQLTRSTATSSACSPTWWRPSGGFYLTNNVDLQVRSEAGETYFESP